MTVIVFDGLLKNDNFH